MLRFYLFLSSVVILFILWRKNYKNFSPNRNIKYQSIDCIRGYLSLGVYSFHFVTWVQYLKIKLWKTYDAYYPVNNFGKFSVNIFFMITAFLFFGKFLDCSFKNFNWKDFLISRIFRLVPMYIFYALISSAFYFALNKSEILNYENIKNYYVFILKFFDFSILNVLKNEAPGIFGVIWTLQIECIFYLSLPLIFLLYKFVKSPKIASIILIYVLSLFYLSLIKSNKVNSIYYLLLGILICFIVRHKQCSIFFSKKYVGFLISTFFLVNFFWNENYEILSIFIVSIFFIIVAVNNSIILNILDKKISYFFSKISYSVYLNHQIVLFIFFNLIGYEVIINMNYIELSILYLAILAIVIIVSDATFTLIEKPFISLGKKLRT